MKRVALVTILTVALASCLAGVALAKLAPHPLVARRSELPGFTSGTVHLRSTTSPSVYAKSILGEGPKMAAKEVAGLKRKGFREAVRELIGTAGGDEALSLALVFGTRKAAHKELEGSIASSVKAQGSAEVKDFTISSIPGAFGFVASEAGHSGAVGNVLFAVGRCFFVVGDSLHTGTPEQAAAAPSSGSLAVFGRAKHLCK